MSAGTYDLLIEQGATWERVFTYKDSSGDPVDLTGYLARLTAVTSYGGDLILEATVGNGRVSIGDEEGTITITIAAEDTADLEAPMEGVYDLEIEAGESGTVTRLLQGRVTVSPEAVAAEPE
jgi:hypothetical protein